MPPATAPPPRPDGTADSIKVYATHVRPQTYDPVEVTFEQFKVVKASFDPQKIEGGTATLEIDLTSLKTDHDKRDQHLASPDYIDSRRFAAATVEISGVKRKADGTFKAQAKVVLRGLVQKYPVTFEVVEAGADWIRIKAEHRFSRLHFRVGRKAGPDAKDDGVSEDLLIKLQLTLQRT
jgi:polyisoprenoid-binding protein YceI